MRTTTWSWSSFMGCLLSRRAWPSYGLPPYRKGGDRESIRHVTYGRREKSGAALTSRGGGGGGGGGRPRGGCSFPGGVGDEGREQPHHDGRGGGQEIGRAQVDQGRPRHDDDEPRRGERGQARPDPEQ